MTRKDYVKFAGVLRVYRNRILNGDYGPQSIECMNLLIHLRNETADIFHSDNSRFDRDRFQDACLE